jgi:hypothetical protein
MNVVAIRPEPTAARSLRASDRRIARVEVFDTALKIFLGTLNLSSAACDLLVPRQTAAFAARNAHLLWRTTLTAVALCAVPALGRSATMPLRQRQSCLFCWQRPRLSRHRISYSSTPAISGPLRGSRSLMLR